jgi:hypothetical protein
MSPHDEEILDGILGDETPPSQRTRRVAELLCMPGARERWWQRCQESLLESRERHERHRAWQAGRDRYLAKAADDPAADGPDPPAEGWERVLGRTFSATGKETTLVAVWVPPELADDQEPYDGGPLPLSPRHRLSLADCFFVLALVHDAQRREGRIDPFPPDDAGGLAFFAAQQSRVVSLSLRDELTLDDCLRRVEADLERDRGVAPSAGAVGAPPAAAAASRGGGAEERPASPTAEYCLIPPNTVRWQGTTEVQSRLFHLLGVLLNQQKWPVPFGGIEDAIDGTGKKLSNAISALNNALSKINFPWTFRTKSAHVTKD